MKAPNFLQAGLDAMQQRAATYDKPEGERSMGATVEAFKAITGHAITEEQGYLFMAILKAVRSQQGNYSADSYIDGAAYFGLAGEAGYLSRAAKAAATHDDNAPAWPDGGIRHWTLEARKCLVCLGDHGGMPCPNMRLTSAATQRPTPTTNAGPMLHCHDCSAEHCPCVAR